MTTHRLTLPPSPRPNWANSATNCNPIHHILQIWPVWLLFVSKLEKVTRWTEICVEWGGRRRYRGLFCRPRENVFFRRVKIVGASLGQVYRAKRRLCWEINRHFSKIFVFLLEAKYLLDHPRSCKLKNISPKLVWRKSK